MSLWCALLGVLALWREGVRQEAAGTATLLRPTVGDTVWLERRFSLPSGWWLRAGALERSEAVEPLGDPFVDRSGADWVIRYPVTAWTPGSHVVALPPVWRLGPGGRADSLPGGTASFALSSVIPDSVTAPAPRPALAPMRPDRRDPRPVIFVSLGAAAALAGAMWWRRRPPRAIAAAPGVAPAAQVADARWLDAGEPKAVAARAAGRLRAAVARAVPEAHTGLSLADCLAAVERHRPQAPVHDLAAVLGALDAVAFASSEDADVAGLARRARRLAEGLGR